MGPLDLLLVSVGLAMDAFAVSVCKGTAARRINWPRVIVTALSFGLFQAFMPIIGWLLGTSIQSFVEPAGSYVAAALLAIIGAKMIWDAFHEDDEEGDGGESTGRFLASLLVLSVATSIDAFVTGISFAMAGMGIRLAAVVIGVTTAILSFLGTIIGNKFGSRFEKWATVAGGVCLILLGIKVLVEHLLA